MEERKITGLKESFYVWKVIKLSTFYTLLFVVLLIGVQIFHSIGYNHLKETMIKILTDHKEHCIEIQITHKANSNPIGFELLISEDKKKVDYRFIGQLEWNTITQEEVDMENIKEKLLNDPMELEAHIMKNISNLKIESGIFQTNKWGVSFDFIWKEIEMHVFIREIKEI